MLLTPTQSNIEFNIKLLVMNILFQYKMRASVSRDFFKAENIKWMVFRCLST